MPTLHERQRQFAAALLSGDSVSGDSALTASVSGAPGHDVDELLSIYRNNLFVSLRESLAVVFPVTLALVGDAFFKHMARRYIRSVPLTEGSVRHYGQGFADFIARQSDAAGLPYLSDVIRLEWARQQVAEAPLPPSPFPFEALNKLTPEQHSGLGFVLAPSWQRLRSRHPVLSIYDMVTRDTPAPSDLTQPETIGLWRRADGLQMQRLSPDTDALVDAIAADRTLSELLDQFGETFMPALQQAIQTGIVTDIRVTHPSDCFV